MFDIFTRDFIRPAIILGGLVTGGTPCVAQTESDAIRCYPYRSGAETFRVCESVHRVTIEALGPEGYRAAQPISAFVQAAHHVQPTAAAFNSPLDGALGVALSSDDSFRGLSLSNHRPSVQAHGEVRALNGLAYARFAGVADTGGIGAPGRFEAKVGIRPELGPLAFDVGAAEHIFVSGRDITAVRGGPDRDRNFAELSGAASTTLFDNLVVKAGLAYSPRWLGTNGDALFASLQAKYLLDETVFPPGLSVSGEVGRNVIGRNQVLFNPDNLPQYTYWNVGVSYKRDNATIDLRYRDSGLSRKECGQILFGLSGVAGSGDCSASLVATLSFDFSMSDLVQPGRTP